ncbi:TetR/AcrR family transcriptional regulator [Actinomadura algeriensis]|uniref:AcrR family transcriptional regulator n=1 Tax=Actinomadura algeriensis TaxID=1679523 RepID=A0ABR9JSB8_9ACTN|nr:TetR/AcrR family transcriptional regulator [Actinomadura algeriensis]MBE1533451.1 AcrR family transcriptional regulator [Actinomadura algeriensis]
MDSTAAAPMSGRKAQAARNDALIREAARAVFTADPGAPISAVAEHAGVGISALYRRYGSKEALLQSLADEGMDRYLAEVERALADDGDPWEAFAAFMRRCLDIGAGSLTMRLAGSFEVTEDMGRKGREIHAATERLLDRTKDAGTLRSEISVGDVSVMLEHLHTIRIGDDARTNRLQHRYLALMLDAMRLTDATELPGPPPGWLELRGRYGD